MNDWSKREINERLLDFINPTWRKQAEAIIAKNNMNTGTTNYYTVKIPDYCNLWSDMGPLIAKHGVTLLHTTNGYSCEGWIASLPKTPFGSGRFNVRNKNPLRAAAICLIKKLEAENV